MQHMDKDEEKTCPSSTNNPTNYTYTIYIKRDNENAPTQGEELDLAAPESNALLLMN